MFKGNDFKKAVGPVVATALFLVVTVVAASTFSNWYTTFQSDFLNNVEKQSADLNNVDLKLLRSTYLTVLNSGNSPINFTNIKIGSKSCDLNGTIPANTIYDISLSFCTLNIDPGYYVVALFSKDNIIEKTLRLTSSLGTY